MNENIIGMICKAIVVGGCAIGGGIAISKALDIYDVKSKERAERKAIEAAERAEAQKIAAAKHLEQLRITEEKEKEEKRRFDEHVRTIMASRDLDNDIRVASINNKNLSVEDRLHAKELLEHAYARVKNSSKVESFDKALNDFDQLLNDIYTNDAEADKAGVAYWWNKHEEQERIRKENQLKQEAENERRRLERLEKEAYERRKKEEEAERKRLEKKAEREREQLYGMINSGLQSIEKVATSVNKNK